MSLKLFSVVILVLSCFSAISIAFRPELTLQDTLDDTGESITTRSKRDNLVCVPVIPDTKRLCAKGIWVLYDLQNYEGWRTRITSLVDEPRCGDYDMGNSPVGSARYLGPPDYTASSISLYEGAYFESGETVITGVFSQIGALPGSMLLTGTESWELYTGIGFDGTCTCVDPALATVWVTLTGDLALTRSITRVPNCAANGACNVYRPDSNNATFHAKAVRGMSVVRNS